MSDHEYKFYQPGPAAPRGDPRAGAGARRALAGSAPAAPAPAGLHPRPTALAPASAAARARLGARTPEGTVPVLPQCPPADLSIVTAPSRLDLDVIHGFLSRSSYWAAGIPRELVARALRHSTCFGAFDGNEQVGFARVISDHATFAYVCDVFVLDSHRGRGVGKQLMAAIKSHPDLQSLRRWVLFTRDAHELYRRFGFSEARHPDRLMEIQSGPYPAAAAGGGGRPAASPTTSGGASSWALTQP